MILLKKNSKDNRYEEYIQLKKNNISPILS